LTKGANFDKKRVGDKKMKKCIALTGLIGALILSLALVTVAFAEGTVKDGVDKKYKETKDICTVVKKLLSDGMNTKEITKASIQLGHDACLVVKCAIEAKGSLEQIITGALEAGATSDVCSRCALEAGADPAAVAKVLETGLGYSTPLLGAGLTPIEVGMPGGEPGRGTLSSSGF
jgi:hypothetical protein